MRVTEIQFEGPPPIDAYGGGGFRVAHVFHPGGLLITPTKTVDWSATGGALTPEDFEEVILEAGTIDVLIIGVGAEIAPLPAPVRARLEEAELGYDIMATSSACRTYNVLLAEDRRVAAALIAV